MFFDALAKIAEAGRLPADLAGNVKRARIFHFPGNPREFLPDAIDTRIIQDLQDGFMLPFPCVAVEDHVSCMLIWDKDAGARGLSQRRAFMECVPMVTNPDLMPYLTEEDRATMESASFQAKYRKSYAVSVGVFSLDDCTEDKFHISGKLMYSAVFNPKGVEVVPKEGNPDFEKLQHSAMNSVGTAMQELMLVNTPDRFIFEDAPVTVKKRGRGSSHVKRSAERPVYSLLHPKAIRERMGLPEPSEGGGRIPHERRAHVRTFRSDRYVNMKGKSVMIPATWIGPSENVLGGRRYRVLLDK